MRYLIFFLSFFYSCSTLQNPHKQNVKAFAVAAKGLSLAPGELYQNVSDYRHELRTIESATLFTTDKVIPRLNAILETKRAFEKNAAQVKGAGLLIVSYTECLLALVDDGYYKNLNAGSKDLSLQLTAALSTYNKSFNKQLPVSVGGFLGLVVNQIGSVKLKQLQKKYLKEFVTNGSFIINDVCDYFTNEMALSLQNEMSSLDKQFENVMSNFYDNIEQYQRKHDVNPFDYLKNYNPLYLRLKEKLTDLHLMQTNTIAAMQQVKTTHELLKTSVDSNLSKELGPKLNELYAAMQDMKMAYLKLKEK